MVYYGKSTVRPVFGPLNPPHTSILFIAILSGFRYRAIMNPLSERYSMCSAKIIILSLWLSSIIMALPNLFFFEFTEVYDEMTGGVKPFCTLSAHLHQPPSYDYSAPLDYNDTQGDAYKDVQPLVYDYPAPDYPYMIEVREFLPAATQVITW